VIFDFNGTLSDDEPILFDIFSELFATHLGWPMTAAEYHDQLLGRSDREIVEYAVARHGQGITDSQTAELMRLRHARYKQRVAEENPITEPAVELVKLLVHHNIPLGIVTGAQRADVLAVLNSSPVREMIDVMVTEEDVTYGKPDPEGFLTAARLLDRQPAELLVFEDSVPGVEAALAADMYCIAVSAHPRPELQAVAPAIVDGLSAELVVSALMSRTQSH
jgi:HAD superfamily hydrolase (TIGR01509 family)